MPILLECPNGHKSFVKDEHAGKKARCPVCRVIVRVPDPRAPAPPPRAADLDGAFRAGTAPRAYADEPDTVEPEDQPAPKVRTSARRAALAVVDKGLRLHYIRQIVFLISLLVLLTLTI